MERRLSAILAADVVGYSRLIGADETGTLIALRSLLKEHVEPTLREYRGRIVKLMGDGLLAEFASVVDAVNASAGIQEGMQKRYADLPEDRRIALRIGVNIGDIVVDGSDILGDGVNIAARLQEKAASGGIALSDDAFRQLRGKLDLPFEDGGQKTLKNIAEPVKIWTWHPQNLSGHADNAAASEDQTEKPSIVVLPFDNMSDDTEQEYFSDGITEDIITALSGIRQLFVLARNTSFTFKGRSVDVQAIARELSVRYVLEGSVRKSGNRVRITAQLINGSTGAHLWAERYDRNMEDIFAVQDEITQVVAAAIEPEISKAEFERVRRTPPENLDAWSMYQHGMHHFHQSTEQSDEEAKRHFRAAIALDPNFSPAYASLARAYSRGLMRQPTEKHAEHIKIAVEAAQKAITLDSEDAYAYVGLGFSMVRSRPEESYRYFETALSMNPNLAVAHYGSAVASVAVNKPSKAKEHIETALRFSPRDPARFMFYGILGSAYFLMEDYEAALDWSSKTSKATSHLPQTGVMRLAALAHLDRTAELDAEKEALLKAQPDTTISRARKFLLGPNEAFIEGLRKAGVPER